MRVPVILERYAVSICSGDFNEWTAGLATRLLDWTINPLVAAVKKGSAQMACAHGTGASNMSVIQRRALTLVRYSLLERAASR